MSWHYNVNQTPTNGAACIAQLVGVLLDAGWVVHAYSNGTGSTRTPGPASSGDVAAALVGNAQAWVAVTGPGGTHSVTFQRGADNRSWWVSYARGGLNTDGHGATIDSSPGDVGDVFATSGSPQPLFPDDDAGGMARCSAGADDTSLAYWLGCWNKATGEARTLLFLDPCSGAHASDGAKPVLCAHHRDGGPWAGTADVLTNMGYSNGPPRTWMKFGVGGAARWDLALPWFFNTQNPGVPVPATLNFNLYDNDDEAFGTHYVSWHGGLNTPFYKGPTDLLAWTGQGRPTGHTYAPAGGGDDRVCIGHLSLPWPAGVPALI